MEAAHSFKIVIPLYRTIGPKISEQLCYVIVLFSYIQGNWTGTAKVAHSKLLYEELL
jgi:hypothetical protein